MANYSDELVKNMVELIKEHDKKILIESISEKQKKEKEQSGDMKTVSDVSKKVVDFSSTAMDFCKKALEAQMENPESIDPARLSAITNLYKAIYSAWFK
ncbi:hypothetical protein [Lactobacillus apis]|uniref:hypothetical protein n=1 Tax=Lactobacillus apis TaxID=303541 RepID=UPI00242CE6B0|nr:hypothetical protein [Lactobacillus apis]